MAVSQDKKAVKEEGAEAQATPPAGAKSKKLVRMGILGAVVLVLGAGGFLAYKFLLAGSKADTEHAAEAKEMPVVPDLAVSLEPFVVNLLDTEGVRYLKVKLDLEVGGATEEEVKKNLPRIRDNLIILLSSKRFEEIGSIEGKLRLREEISQRLDQVLGQGNLRQVYFTDFVVQ